VAPVSRRELLRGLGGAASLAAAGLVGCGRPLPRARMSAEHPARGRKLIFVQFGGGTRSSESIDDPGHRFIPRLWKELVPRGTLFTDVRVEHRVVHPNSTGSMMTGHWEWDDLDWSRPVAHPTLFELARRAWRAPDTDAWAFVYASILALAGASRAAGFGDRYAANVVEPPTIPRAAAEAMDRLMSTAAASGSVEEELVAVRRCAQLARSTSRISEQGLRSARALRLQREIFGRWRAGQGTTSHDAFLTESAIACMQRFAPTIAVVAFGEIDCAHYGSWSRYTEAILRTDALTHRLWQAAQRLPAYREQTLMLIVPDHGRESGGEGFVHHSDFYTNQGADESCRRVWMLALGPEVAAGRVVRAPTPLTAVAATGLEFLGLEASRGAAGSVLSSTRRTS
jgi:hypothetical protein